MTVGQWSHREVASIFISIIIIGFFSGFLFNLLNKYHKTNEHFKDKYGILEKNKKQTLNKSAFMVMKLKSVIVVLIVQNCPIKTKYLFDTVF